MGFSLGGFLSKMFVGEKGIVGQISDTADKWFPSETSKHKMSLDDMTAGDASQESARGMVFVSHDSYFDIIVDAANRMPRPLFTFWAFGLLVGWWDAPEHLLTMNPVVLNILWTIVTFWFGARLIVKDIPGAIRFARKIIKK